MAEHSGSQLTLDWFGLHTRVYNMTDWTNGQDSAQNKGSLVSSNMSELDYQRRSEVVHAIIYNHSMDHLGTILGSGWDISETLRIPDHQVRTDENGCGHLDYHFEQKTALGEAVEKGWTEGVKILLDVGAECKTSDILRNSLTLALQNLDCPPDLIELLLKHGSDPNDHNNQLENIPLLHAINNCNQRSKIVQLLLEHGADPNVTGRTMGMVCRTALHEATRWGWTEGVKMLLDAGAKFMMSDKLDNPLTLALQNGDHSQDLIELLLKHGADPNFHRSEEDIPLLCAITDSRNNVHLSEIVKLLLKHGANPNVTGMVYIKKWVQSTALHEAARRGWTEGVKMLLDAGAQCKTSSALQNPLMLALQNHDCPVDLIELLLKHGADPNHHDGTVDNIPLLQQAISNCRNNPDLTKIVKLLLEHGADPNVSGGRNSVRKQYPLSAALDLEFGVFVTLFQTLVDFGADVNYNVAGRFPLLQKMMFQYSSSADHINLSKRQLDLFFLHGGNINMEYNDHRTALEYAVNKHASSNIIRWLIRHGADTSPIKVTLLKEQLIPYYKKYHYIYFPDTLLILLQAGMRVSHGAQIQLSNMEVVIAAWLQDGWDEDEDGSEGDEEDLWAQLEEANDKDLWAQLEEADDGEPQRMQHNFRKSNFPEYWTWQMVDLQEFSDESLEVYPQDNYVRHTGDIRQRWQKILDQIDKVLEFLSQTQSLQWYCRCCVRENLVSLQPSVVKTLPIPARLKRYILCHEI